MTLPIFPSLNGQAIEVKKKPSYATIVASHVSGREVRQALYKNPIWEFELAFSGLDSTQSGQYGGLGGSSLQTLMGFFLQCQGQLNPFAYYDPNDNSAVAQSIGIGDGVTVSFQLTRTLGAFTESIVLPVTSPMTITFPNGGSLPAGSPVLSANGTTIDPSTYIIATPGGTVTFAVPPSAGVALQWTGYFGFLCRFGSDDLDFEQFMSNLWRVDSVKFRSLRTQ